MSQLPHTDSPTGYETSDARPKPLFLIALGLLGLIFGTLLLLYWLNNVFKNNAPEMNPPVSATSAPAQTPLPALQVDPPRDLMDLRRREDSVLTSYGWVDRDSGIVQIPIEKAIELLLMERGKYGKTEKKERK